MASPLARRRILAAQLDGATRRLEAARRGAGTADVDDQQRRVESLRAEIAAHDERYGAPVERGAGGLWGPDGPARTPGRLYSSGARRRPHSDDRSRATGEQ